MQSLAEFSRQKLAEEDYPRLSDYKRLLQNWIDRAHTEWQPWPLVHRTGTFGRVTGGNSAEAFAVRSTAEYAAACAVLWQKETDWPLRDLILEQIVGSIRFVTSAFRLAKNESVSLHMDFSPLWRRVHYIAMAFSPAALAARFLWDQLCANDRSEVEYMVCSLANTLAEAEIRATVEGHFSTPEQNAWNAEFLLNACQMFCEHVRCAEWREKALCYLVNSFSRALDHTNGQLLDGKPIKARFVGANVHPNFSIEHHGVFHPNYMIHPIQRRGTIYLLCQWAGEPMPESALYGVSEVWGVVKRLILSSGRIVHPSGQDHNRYVRPEHFLLPACVFMEKAFKDADARHIERRTFATLEWEQEVGGDGHFHLRRLSEGRDSPGIGPMSEEANAAFNLSLAYLMHRETPPLTLTVPEGSEARHLGVFSEPDAKVVFSRSNSTFVSWSWRAYPGPACGLFIPQNGDHLAVWHNDMVSQYEVEGFDCSPEQSLVDYDKQETFESGFAATGKIEMGRAESDLRSAKYALAQHLSFVALPDGETAVLHTLVTANEDVVVKLERHLRLNVANDIFNGMERTVKSESGALKVLGLGEYARETVRSRWISIDGMLAIVAVDSDGAFTLERFPRRPDRRRSLAWNTVSCPYNEGRLPFSMGQTVRRSTFVFSRKKTPAQLRDYCATALRSFETRAEEVFCTLLTGGGGERYLIGTNFGDESHSVVVELPFSVGASRLLTKEGNFQGDRLSLPGRSTVVVQLSPV